MKLTLRRLFEKLRAFTDAPAFYNGFDPYCDIKRKLDELKGEKIGEGNYAVVYLFKFSSGSYVAKIATSGEGVNRIRRDTLENNPFFSQRYVRPIFASKYVVVQPYIKPLEGKRAERASHAIGVRLTAGETRQNDWSGWEHPYDSHDENIGYCPRRKIVMIFDAMNFRD